MNETLNEAAHPNAAAAHAYRTIDSTRVGHSIHEYHDLICTHGQRVEITRADCKDRCVLISKSELDSMEKALEIFADTEAFAEMSRNIQQLLETAGLVYSHEGQGQAE